MFEMFTDRSRKVMQLAQQEAHRLNHEYVGTEHILLGLVKEGSGVAANVLKNLDIDLRKIRLEIEKIVQAGLDVVNMDKLLLTPRATYVLEYAIEEARNNYVGTEHILLGIMREQEGVAVQVLINLGLKIEDVQEEIMALLGNASSNKPISHQNDRIADLMVLAQVEAIIRHKGSTSAKKIMQDIQHLLNEHLRDPGPDLRDPEAL